MASKQVMIIGTLVEIDSGAHPEHPIYYPPGIWGPTDPRPGWGLPGQPPGIWGGGNVPMPTPPIPIYPGGTPNPPGTWGGAGQPFPTPPIPIYPGGTPNPPGIWGPPGPWPQPPIHIPPDLKPPTGTPEHPINKPPIDAPPGFEWRFVYAPNFGGWIWVLVPESKTQEEQ